MKVEGRAGRRVQCALNRRVATIRERRCQHWKILQVVGTAVAVAGVVRSHAVLVQVNPDTCVGVN